MEGWAGDTCFTGLTTGLVGPCEGGEGSEVIDVGEDDLFPGVWGEHGEDEIEFELTVRVDDEQFGDGSRAWFDGCPVSP